MKAFYLDRIQILSELKKIAKQAGKLFPEIEEIRIFGSFSKGEETGLSDIDLFLIVEKEENNPITRMKPYFYFFSENIDLSLDMIVALKSEKENFKELLQGSILLYKH